jgi:hypothetical protein
MSGRSVLSAPKKNALDTALVQWLLESGLPFNLVRDPAFSEMLNVFLRTTAPSGEYTTPRERRLNSLCKKKSRDHTHKIQKWLKKGCASASISVDGMCIYLHSLKHPKVGHHLQTSLIGQL